MTTPEKWDAFTRFRSCAHGVIGRVGLVMIDEIHLLAEPDRGPTLEAIDVLEAEFKVNVMSALQVIVWDALRRVGIDDKIKGAGRLLREF